MNTSEQILVIILSSTLAILLIICIVAAVKTVQILNDVKRIVKKAESIADKAEAVGDFFKASAGPAAITKLLANIFNAHKSNKSEGKKE